MKIKALKPFTLRDSESGELFSVACSQVLSTSDEAGAQLISDGLAEEYTLISPTGNKDIDANGEYDVTEYATVTVSVE